MKKSQKKSSRLRMTSRGKGSKKQQPTVIDALSVIENRRILVNRAFRKHDLAWKRGAPGRSVREEARNIRKSHMTAARRVLRKIRKEIRQALFRKEA